MLTQYNFLNWARNLMCAHKCTSCKPCIQASSTNTCCSMGTKGPSLFTGLNDSLLDDYIMRVMTTFLAVSASPAILNSTDVSLAKSRWNAPMLYKHAANKYTTWASSQLVRKGESQRGEFDYYIECESSYKRVPKVRQETKGK